MKTVVSRWKYLLVCILSVGVLTVPFAPVVYADDPPPVTCGDASFLGFPAWYNGLLNEDDCGIKSPDEAGGFESFIWTIVLNIVTMILVAAGYAATGFIIYGGYKYMISAGSPDGMMAARKTITNAVIGLIISVAAIAIINTLSSGLGIG